MITSGQQRALDIRERLMKGTPKPPSFRAKIVAIRRRVEEAASRPKPITPPRIFSVLKMPTDAELAAMPNWRKIAYEVALKHNLTVADLLCSTREAYIVKARYEAMWRLSRESNLSTTQIGRFFKRDHTTALHGIRKHQWRLDQEVANGPANGA